MKEKYIAPTAETVNFESVEIICASGNTFDPLSINGSNAGFIDFSFLK